MNLNNFPPHKSDSTKVGPHHSFEVVQAKDLLEELNEFYKSCDRKTNLNPVDTVVISRLNSKIIAVVRLCFEDDVHVLRTMQVKADFQGKGIGRLTLNHFELLIKNRNIDRVYCMPFAHLETFYNLIDFKRIEINQAPAFLQKRIEEFHRSHTDEHVILMVKRL